MEKIFVRLEPDAWHGHSFESLWATKLEDGIYRVENSPFFVKGLAFEDIVETQVADGANLFVKTVTSSGRSTYRIIPNEGTDEAKFDSFWTPLKGEGCTYEQGNFGYDIYSVDVPDVADIHKVFALLETGLSNSVWDFEEGCCCHRIDG